MAVPFVAVAIGAAQAIGRSLLTTLTNAIRSGTTQALQKSASVWFKKIVRQKLAKYALKQMRSPGQILAQSEKSAFWEHGSMYFFAYNPKHKNTLPYYDMFPLVIPIKRYSDGFLGINFHYLYHKDRAILLDQLMAFANNKELNEETRLKLSYESLGNFTKYRRARPCIHRYLDGYMRSPMVPVEPTDWGTALFLPVERFKKMNKSMVWAESQSKMQNIHL